MIQRIQSALLFLAALCTAALFLSPVTVFHIRNTSVYMDLTGFAGEGEIYNTVAGSYWFPLFTILAAAIVLLLIACIFSYKNRQRQIKLCTTGFFLEILLIGMLFLVPDSMANRLEPGIDQDVARIVQYRWTSFLPFLSLILIRFSIRFIKKDEELVRSADRLR